MYAVGDRVVANSPKSSLHGREGSIVVINEDGSYKVDWDFAKGNSYGRWTDAGLLPIPDVSESLAHLRGAVIFAKEIFEYYAKLHAEKGTSEGDFKASTNMGFAALMQNALESS